jgi:hypothetical protein
MIEPELVIVYLDDERDTRAATAAASVDEDPGTVVLTCANCGAAMDERKCKLICLSAARTAFLVHRDTEIAA